MIRFEGKYTTANVMIDNTDMTTAKQITQFVNHPAFENCSIAIMPDCHAGKGAVVGFTAPLGKYVIPNVIGVDIGCGVLTTCLGRITKDFSDFDRYLRQNIPSGFKNRNIVLDLSSVSDKFLTCVRKICSKIQLDYNKVLCSLGTLGGGNHFIEIGDNNGKMWLTVHTGSRHFGLRVATYHQGLVRCIEGTDRELSSFLTESACGQEYLSDMYVAQEFARINRQTIMKILLAFFGYGWNQLDNNSIESVHNYVGKKDKIIRKGAISAYEKEKVIVPINMRDGTIIGIGKGNALWNYSAPHGAGRVLSRSQAKKSLNVGVYKKQMEGIWTSCVGQSTLDEAPDAYKPIDLILESIDDTMSVDFIIKPVYNFKA